MSINMAKVLHLSMPPRCKPMSVMCLAEHVHTDCVWRTCWTTELQPDSLFLCCVYGCTFGVSYYSVAQSHPDDSHVHATAPCFVCVFSQACPINVIHSSSTRSMMYHDISELPFLCECWMCIQSKRGSTVRPHYNGYLWAKSLWL